MPLRCEGLLGPRSRACFLTALTLSGARGNSPFKVYVGEPCSKARNLAFPFSLPRRPGEEVNSCLGVFRVSQKFGHDDLLWLVPYVVADSELFKASISYQCHISN
jgi:hypothetical protein